MASSNGITFVPGDLVVSLVGNTDGSAPGDNQASPIELVQLSLTGTANGTMLLPQTTMTTNGVTQYAISGEYGSSSEGSLELSADGQSITIAGYGINAATYNSAEANVTGSKAAGGTYGNNALAQTYSVANGGTNGSPAGVTPVARVVADISTNGTVDTSTALLNIDNENNPRSAATVDGTSFYVAGQGVKGDTTQGVSYAADGATTPTTVNTTADMRTAEIYNGNLYVSMDSKQGSAGFTANIAMYNGLPTAGATPTILPGISQSVTLTAAQENGVNNASVGKAVNLSPENFYFANATTLYVADGGTPKGGGLGDGGLQKWTLSKGTWSLQYTLSAGLNLVANTTADLGAGGQASTGLIGLTGRTNVDGTVSLYATNATVGDLNNTYLYGITDTATATAPAANESFTQLYAAPAGTNVRGVAFAPAAAVACYCTGTLIRLARGDIAVEHLVVGDLLVTISGAHRPIRWIGHRAYAARFANANPDLLPICVKAGAVAEAVPSRDLWVSPKHALSLDGVLIPAAALVNGASIVKAERVDDNLTYWHVELDSHDVILAENTPAESFVDDEGRGIFHNAHTFYALYPDAEEIEAVYCAPRLESGHIVAAVRRRFAERAGLAEMPAALFGDLRGHVDLCDGHLLTGWARDSLYPDAPVCLDILVDGELVALTYADLHRPDLEAAGFGAGCHGFSLELPLTLEAAHTVEVRRSADSVALAGSPWLVATAASARAA